MPVFVAHGPAPQPFMADGRERLLYELHLTNYAPLPIELRGIDILGERTTVLAIIRGPALGKVVIPVEKLSTPDEPPNTAMMSTGKPEWDWARAWSGRSRARTAAAKNP